MIHLNGSERLYNFTNKTSNNPFFCSYPVYNARIACIFTVLILSIIGNVLVIAIFYRNKTLRTNVHYFIVNMAVSDVFIPLTYVLPLVSALLHKDNRWLLNGIVGSVTCKLWFYSWQVSRFVSLFSMMATAADRFRAILYPFKPALIQQNRRPLVITAIWFASMAFPAYFLYGARLVSYENRSYCVVTSDSRIYTRNYVRVFYLIFFCTTASSAVILTALYAKIILHLYKEKRTLNLASEIIKARAKRNRKITTMFIVVVLAFYVFWSPFAVSTFTWIFKQEELLQCNGLLGVFAHLVYPAVNSLIYFIFNKNYSRGFRELVCCRGINSSSNAVLPLNGQNAQPRRAIQRKDENDRASNAPL